MLYAPRLSLFPDVETPRCGRSTSGSFVGNMGLPVHRWFRYSAGFSGAWAAEVIGRAADDGNARSLHVFDPFAGCGTTPSRVCFVVGDSAPYGVYVPAIEWLGKLAVAAGFRSYDFEKIRDRNVKWMNRKHRVPLCEGRLWVEG